MASTSPYASPRLSKHYALKKASLTGTKRDQEQNKQPHQQQQYVGTDSNLPFVNISSCDDERQNDLDITWLRSRRRHIVDVSGAEKKSSFRSLLKPSLAKKAEESELLRNRDLDNCNLPIVGGGDRDSEFSPLTMPTFEHQVEYGASSYNVDYGEKCDKNVDDNPNFNSSRYKSYHDANGYSKKSLDTDINSHYSLGIMQSFLAQIPAIAIACLLNLMLAIPFGVVYFPVGWSSDTTIGNNPSANNPAADGEEDVHGPFPLPGKESLGIRMCLFATLVGQLVMTFASKFENPICFQMIENVPFFHALAYITIKQQGYGKEALSTLFFLFGSSSVMVGLFFYLLGRLEMGKIVYFFPDHVLVGCIGGIGVFIGLTAVEVTINESFSLDMDSIRSLIEHFHLFGIVLFFEITLRILVFMTTDKKTKLPKYPLLPPIFYCMITPLFYLTLYILKINLQDANDAGYFFPSIPSVAVSSSGNDNGVNNGWISIFNDGHIFDLLHIIDFRTISWTTVFNSIPTVTALTVFSLIHVPINIPAFSISTDVETDMNNELIAHGYSNALSGLFGGLPNYMTYSSSILYAKSGGFGRASSLVICFVTFIFFIIGPSIATYIPRCMAGTLLLHVGVDLFLEGVYDSYGSYDKYEYTGIWFIAVVMTAKGMTAALIAGIIVALLTYAAQSITHLYPIHKTMNASILRSSSWNRNASSLAILDDDDTGRSRIFIIQLQGHLFFGNTAQMTDTIKGLITGKRGTDQQPLVVIMDFTLVVGMDSSAAHSVANLKKALHRLYDVELSVFVTGCDRGGFPCEYALSQFLIADSEDDALAQEKSVVDLNDIMHSSFKLHNADDEGNMRRNNNSKPRSQRGSISFKQGSAVLKAFQKTTRRQNQKDHVCESLDVALVFAEDMLIAREDPKLLEEDNVLHQYLQTIGRGKTTIEEEQYRGVQYLINIGCQDPNINDEMKDEYQTLFSYFVREEYRKDEIIWSQHMPSDSAKLLVCGSLISSTEYTNSTEVVATGNIVGEFGLIQGHNRFNTLKCYSDTVVLYSINKDSWDELCNEHPKLARIIDAVCIRYLSHRIQHVRNRTLDVSGLPV